MSDVDIDYDYIDDDKETKHALFVVVDSDFPEKTVWVPKSLVQQNDEQSRILTLPEWFATEEELI